MAKESILESLLQFLNEEEEASAGIYAEQEEIMSIDQANYYARKVKEIRQQKEEITESAKEQLQIYQDRIAAWQDSLVKPLENQEARLLSMLEQFAMQQLDGTSKQSIKLVEGTLAFRKQQDEVTYNDELLLDFIKRESLPYITVKETVNKKELKSAITDKKDGVAYIGDQPIPGLSIQERPKSFDIK